MIGTVAEKIAVRVTRLIQAPRERVFAAWTTPADILKWFGPETCRALSARADLRTGGKYHYELLAEKFGEIELRGVFREVEPGRRLVYTWTWSGHPELAPGESLVTVEFMGENGMTEVEITHEGLPNEKVRDEHTWGWNGCLDKLEEHLVSGVETEQPAPAAGEFCWNELLTSDEQAAAEFYAEVFGWQRADFPGGGMEYALFKREGRCVGGMMRRPNEYVAPHWLGYVTVESVDATAKKATDLGANLIMPPFDVPTVGRIAVFQDPQGAAIGLHQPINKPAGRAANQIVWFDVPVTDLERAIRFYSAVLAAPIRKEEMSGRTFALLPHEGQTVGGCLSPGCEGNENKPSPEGPLLYFNCQGRLDQAIAAVQPNGGKVLQPRHPIGPYGFRAVVLDSEGNRIALHSR